MIVKGINLGFLLRLLLRIINTCKIDFQIRDPDSSDLVKLMNDLVKEFI